MKFYITGCIIFCLLFTQGCKKSVDVSDPFKASFQAVINNVPVSLTESGNHYWGSSSSTSPNINGTDSTSFRFGSGLAQYLEGSTYINSIVINFFNHIPNDSLDYSNQYPELFENTFRHLLKTGNYPYTYDSFIKSGIIVTWYDDKGVRWASGKIHEENNAYPVVPPDYSHNAFNIIYSEPVTLILSYPDWTQEVHLTFNCRVYNYSGDSLSIENAKLQGIYSYIKND